MCRKIPVKCGKNRSLPLDPMGMGFFLFHSNEWTPGMTEVDVASLLYQHFCQARKIVWRLEKCCQQQQKQENCQWSCENWKSVFFDFLWNFKTLCVVFFGEYLIQPSAPVIPCEVRCLGTQTKPTPEPLAEGSSEHTDICIISSLLIILHAFWVNEIIHLKCQAKPSVVWDLVIGGWGFGWRWRWWCECGCGCGCGCGGCGGGVNMRQSNRIAKGYTYIYIYDYIRVFVMYTCICIYVFNDMFGVLWWHHMILKIKPNLRDIDGRCNTCMLAAMVY